MPRRHQGEDRVLTLPNLVTGVRLALIPVYVVLLAHPHRAHWQAAGILLLCIGATDFVDGQLARRLHQVSTVGKVLDPVADRLLLAVAAISIIAVGAAPLWVIVVALVREVVVAGGFLVVATLGGRRMDVSWPGKAATFGLMGAMPAFLIGHSTASWHGTAETIAWVAAVPGLVLGWVSAVGYYPRARRALAERGRPDPAAAGEGLR
jgi:cardiolipin synthase